MGYAPLTHPTKLLRCTLMRLSRKSNPAARPRQSSPTGKSPKTLSIPSRKKISLPSSGKSVILICPSHPIRGALRTSRTLRWDAVDAIRRATSARCRGRRSRVVLTPRCWRSSWRRCLRIAPTTVAKEPGHRGEHEVSRKPPRRESRRYPVHLWSYPRAFFVARGPWVQSAPGFPCALCFMRGRTSRKARAHRAARMLACVRTAV